MAGLTVSQIESRILNRINNKLDALQVREIIEEKYREIFNINSWSFGKYSGGFLVIGPSTTGTITATTGSTTITGSSTDFLPSVGSYSNGWLKAGGSIYRVSGTPASDTALTLDAGYAGAGGSGLGYTLLQNRYELTAGVTHLLSITIGQYALVESPISYLLEIDPNRDASGQPLYFAYCGMGSSGGRIIELYPSPDTKYRVNYEGLKLGSFALTASTTVIEEQLTSYIFNTSLAECCRVIAMKNEDINTASFWMSIATPYEEKATQLFGLLSHKDLSSFGAPYLQRSATNSSIYSEEFMASHDMENDF